MSEGNGIRERLEAEWRERVTRELDRLDQRLTAKLDDAEKRIRSVESTLDRLGGIGLVAKIIIPAIVSAIVAFIVKRLFP